MKKTDYILLGIFLVGVIAACVALRALPCPPLNATGNASPDGLKPTTCQSFGVAEF